MLNHLEILNEFKQFLINSKCKQDYVDPFMISLNSLLLKVDENSLVLKNQDGSYQTPIDVFETLNKEHFSIKSSDRRMFNSFISHLIKSEILIQGEDQSYFQFNNAIVKHVMTPRESQLTDDWASEKERANSWRKSHSAIEDQLRSSQDEVANLKEDLEEKEDQIETMRSSHLNQIEELKSSFEETHKDTNEELKILRQQNSSITERMLSISEANAQKIENLTSSFTEQILNVQNQLIELTKLALKSQPAQNVAPVIAYQQPQFQSIQKKVEKTQPVEMRPEIPSKQFIPEEESKTPPLFEKTEEALTTDHQNKIDEEFQDEKSEKDEPVIETTQEENNIIELEPKAEPKKRRRIKPEYKSAMKILKPRETYNEGKLRALKLWNDYSMAEEDLRTEFDNDMTKVQEGLIEKFGKGDAMAVKKTFEEMNGDVVRTGKKWKENLILEEIIHKRGRAEYVGQDYVGIQLAALSRADFANGGLSASSIKDPFAVEDPIYFDEVKDLDSGKINDRGEMEYNTSYPRHESTSEELDNARLPYYSKQFEDEIKDGKLIDNLHYGPLTDMLFFDPQRLVNSLMHRDRDFFDEKDKYADERWNSTGKRLFEANIDQHQYVYNVQADALFFHEWSKKVTQIVRFYRHDNQGKLAFPEGKDYHALIYGIFSKFVGEEWDFSRLETVPGWAYLTEWRRREIIAFANYHRLAMHDIRQNGTELITDKASQNAALNEMLTIIELHEEEIDPTYIKDCLDR